jgi:glycosyltransferase involved in cell wall biosynthesis
VITPLKFSPFYQKKDWKVLYSQGRVIQKGLILLIGFIKRIRALFNLGKFDFIFIHREVTPVGPPVFEWIISKVFKKKIIYDFDDAIWLTDRTEESWLLRTIRWRRKVQTICTWSYKVSCGNEFLCSFARQFNNHVVYNPTTIDTEKLHNPSLYQKRIENLQDYEKIVIGWTGSHTTLKYLQSLESVLQRVENQFPQIEVWVIADQPPALKLKSLRFKPWSIETEISDLSRVDIGIMPLPDDEWAKGKCGFKALQYMALGIPTIASSVGVNTTIILHGADGFLASKDEDWENFFIRLIENKMIRGQIGLHARKKILNSYSVTSNSSTFLSLFA